ncbi:MAG TPA: hypothetical protein VN622_02070 [Clostridia bacterium]|nr:hypothetical protein [Clostridia bacterium]
MANNLSNGRPRIACEVMATRVTAARVNATRHVVEAVHSRTLPPGAVTPNLLATNVAEGSAVRDAIEEMVSTVAGRTRDVIAIVPDAAVRIVLLEFDTLPERRLDADSVVRFRLKKSLPFDIDKAALSYDVARAPGMVKVVAAVTPSAVLQEYEQVFRDAGCNPGIVMPSTIAALGAVDTSRPTLVLKVDADTSSVAILNHGELLLYRTLENGGTIISGERLAEDVYPSVVFFQDTFGVNVERVLVAGRVAIQDVAPALEAQTGSRVQELVGLTTLAMNGNTDRSELAGVVGALIG